SKYSCISRYSLNPNHPCINTQMDNRDNQLINSLEIKIQNLTGKDFKFNKVERRRIKAKFKQLDKFRREWYEQNYNSSKEGDRKELFLNFANELTKVALNIPNSANPVLDMTDYHVAGILSLDERYRFVKETNFLEYKEAICNLIEEIYNQQKYEDIRKF
ncbi:MAG: hypothetical protein ACRD8Z_11235, partial [Nitrososphaeraceae archaeon]